MNVENIRKQFEALSPDDQKRVADFITSLSEPSYQPASEEARRRPLCEEPFFGQWKDRTDIPDSVTYVRELRRREWRVQDGGTDPGGHERSD